LGAFAKQAILHQPWDYLGAVLTDLAKFVDPSINPRPYAGQSPATLSFAWRDTDVEQLVVNAMSRRYLGTTVRLSGQSILGHYQNIFRLSGLSICGLAFFTLLGMFKARGPLRLGVSLFGLSALALYLLPVATVSYDYRYGMPPGILITVAGVLGAASCWSPWRMAGNAKTGAIEA
jgi:hypothetical protein